MALTFEQVESILGTLGFWCLLIAIIGSASSGFLIGPKVGALTFFTLTGFGVGLLAISFASFTYQLRSSATLRIESKSVLLVTTVVALTSYPLLNLYLELSGIASGRHYYDFPAYYNAAERAIHGYPLYTHSSAFPEITYIPNANTRYLYAPIMVLLFLPFAFLPYEVATIAWSAFSIIVLWVGIITLLRTYEIRLTKFRIGIVLWCAIGYAPTITSLKAGQISNILAGLLCFAAASMEIARRPENSFGDWLLGSFVTLPVIVKAFYAPAGAHLFRNWKWLFGAAGVGLAALVSGVALFGISAHLEYLEVLAAGKGWGAEPVFPSEWNAITFDPLYVFGPLQMPIRIALFATVAAFSLYSRKWSSIWVDRYVFCLGILALVIGGPTVNTLTLNALIPVIIILLVTEFRRVGGVPTAVLGALLLVHVHPYTIEFLAKFGLQYVPELSAVSPVVPIIQPAVWGVVILAGLVISRLWLVIDPESVICADR